MAASGLAIAEVVILNPGFIKGQVSFGAETVTSFEVSANSTDGFSSYQTFTANPYSLTVESGHDYRPRVRAYFSNPTAGQSYLEVSRTGAVTVDNQVGPTTADFIYPSSSRINFLLGVTGGVINSYYIYASASAATENYFASTYRGFGGSPPTSAMSWVPMLPDEQVNVYGTVYLTTASGTQVQRSLATKTVNLLQGGNSVSWEVDLANMGQLTGQLSIAPASGVSYHYVYFNGIYNTPSYGVSGSKYVTANGAYTTDLPPGDYDVYLRTYLSSPSGYFDTKRYRVTVTAGSSSTLDFNESLGTAQVPLSVSGFFSNADLSWSSMRLVRREVNSTTYAEGNTLANGRFDVALPAGDWKRESLSLGLYDNGSNPLLPLNVVYYRTIYTDSSVPTLPVPAGTTVSLGAENVTLVRTNAYFDVQEATPEAPEILLSSPQVSLFRQVNNPDNSLKTYTQAHAAGSSESRGTSAFIMAAEPGTYTMQAFATVNGSRTQFSTQNITFAPPAQTPPGVDVVVTPVEDEELKVQITFPQVTGAGGITTVVETPLAPEPPQGLKTFCEDGASAEGIECSPLFYDIETTAAFSTATVCIRRKFQGANGLSTFLRLYHYDEVAGLWEELPPPPGMEPTIDCASDLAACGCVDEASCGIDFESDPPVSVIMVCGVTDSFSPFAIFEKDIKFSNTVNGQTYEGPTGPPSLQTWTVPATATYRITATGASGASATQAQAQGLSGGCGARLSGEFALQGGDTLQILVGQKGTAATYSGGGGGGSFVTRNGAPLVIAGGGGGVRAGATVPGRPASAGKAGVPGSVSAAYTSGFVAGGTDGQGGARAVSYGSGGGGWVGNGAFDGSYGEGGFAFLAGGKGGAGKSCGGLAHGGYGGGGAGNGCYGGGGGGGYSGGGGGRVGGGGGSWNDGAMPSNVEGAGACTPSGHGRVTIEYVH